MVARIHIFSLQSHSSLLQVVQVLLLILPCDQNVTYVYAHTSEDGFHHSLEDRGGGGYSKRQSVVAFVSIDGYILARILIQLDLLVGMHPTLIPTRQGRDRFKEWNTCLDWLHD